MSGLNLTKSHVKGISDTGHFYVKDIETLTTDWLAMYDLLKEVLEHQYFPEVWEDKIRALIGGE